MLIVLGQKLTGKAFQCSEWILRKNSWIGTIVLKIFPIQGKKAAVENHSGYSRLGMGESNFIPQSYNEETADL